MSTSCSNPQHEAENRQGEGDSYPPFDPGSSTVRLSWLGILLATVCAIACIVWASIVLTTRRHLAYPTSLSEGSAEALAFTASILLTFITDTLGYIHSVSLRWALYREGRLAFNTNIRLLSSAHLSAVNSWPVNLTWASFLILCYSCTSILFIRGPDKFESSLDGTIFHSSSCAPGNSCISLNGMSLLLLGVGLAVQNAIALMCMQNHRQSIPTWGSNPLNNTLAALQCSDVALFSHAGRCMIPVSHSLSPLERMPVYPSRRQRNLWFILMIRWIVAFTWGLTVLTFLWATIVMRVAFSMYDSCTDATFNWSSMQVHTINGNQYPQNECYVVYLGMDPASNSPSTPTHFSLGAHFVLSIFFLCGVQGATTICLHCIEAVVNMRRDEQCWRACTSRKGGHLSTSPILGLLRSWEAIVLFAIKSALHWLLGQSLIPQYGPGSWYDGFAVLFGMAWPRLYVLACVTAFAALFVTGLACWKPCGSQPAAWGHLQTLANLVDFWCSPSEKLWWGDKGISEDRIRHAGTSSIERLPRVREDTLYAGTNSHLRLSHY